MNIALVDDSIMVRANLTSLPTKLPGVYVVGHAASEDEAVALINLKHPDLVLMDISLEKGTGLEALRRIRLAAMQVGSGCSATIQARSTKGLGANSGPEIFSTKV